MKWTKNQTFGLVVCLALSVSLSGCFGSSKGGTVLDGRLNDDGAPPYTEVFIEYPGPSEKWAGPHSVLAHLSAQSGKNGDVTVSHAGFKLSEFRPTMPMDQAREQLERIHSVVNQELKASVSCSAPVKIRLVRSDGALIAKQACRGQSGWPRIASDLTAQWMGMAFAAAEKPSEKAIPEKAPASKSGVEKPLAEKSNVEKSVPQKVTAETTAEHHAHTEH